MRWLIIVFILVFASLSFAATFSAWNGQAIGRSAGNAAQWNGRYFGNVSSGRIARVNGFRTYSTAVVPAEPIISLYTFDGGTLQGWSAWNPGNNTTLPTAGSFGAGNYESAPNSVKITGEAGYDLEMDEYSYVPIGIYKDVTVGPGNFSVYVKTPAVTDFYIQITATSQSATEPYEAGYVLVGNSTSTSMSQVLTSTNGFIGAKRLWIVMYDGGTNTGNNPMSDVYGYVDSIYIPENQ